MADHIQAIIEAGKKDKRPAFIKRIYPNDEFTPLNQATKDSLDLIGYASSEINNSDLQSKLEDLTGLLKTISRGIKKIRDYRPKDNAKGIANRISQITNSIETIQKEHLNEYSYNPKFKLGENIDGYIKSVCEEFNALQAGLNFVSYRVRETWPAGGLEDKWPGVADNMTRKKWLEDHAQTMLNYKFKNEKGEESPLFNKVEITKGKDFENETVFIRTYHTTAEKLAYYWNGSKERAEVFKSSGDAFPQINDKANPIVKFDFGFTNEDIEKFESLGKCKNPQKIYSSAAAEKVMAR